MNNQKAYLEKLFAASIFLFVIAYPYSIKWCNAGMFATCFFAIFSNSLQEKLNILRNNRALWLLPLLFFVMAIGMSYNSDLLYGWKIIEKSVGFILFPLLLGTSSINPRVLNAAARLFVLNSTAVAIYCLVSNYLFFLNNQIEFRHFFSWEYTYDHFEKFIALHPTYSALMMLISLTVVMFLFPYQRPWHYVMNYLLIIFLSGFVILLGSKIGIVMLLLLLNLRLFRYIAEKKRKLLLLGYLVLNVAFFIVALNTHVVYWRFRMSYETVKNTLAGNELSDYRILHWKCATAAIREKPLLGWGTTNRRIPLNACYEQMGMKELLDYNAHNQFLESWIQIGLAGLFISLSVLAVPWYISIREKSYFFAFIFLMYLIAALTESIFVVQKGIVLFCFISSAYLGPIRGKTGSNQKSDFND